MKASSGRSAIKRRTTFTLMTMALFPSNRYVGVVLHVVERRVRTRLNSHVPETNWPINASSERSQAACLQFSLFRERNNRALLVPPLVFLATRGIMPGKARQLLSPDNDRRASFAQHLRNTLVTVVR